MKQEFRIPAWLRDRDDCQNYSECFKPWVVAVIVMLFGLALGGLLRLGR